MEEPEVTEVSLALGATKKNKNLKESMAFSKLLKAKKILITPEKKHLRRESNQFKLNFKRKEVTEKN